MSQTYDGVLLGGGHQSLILQAYAGRAGLSTVCLEVQPQAGGGLTTEEYPAGSGFWHNTHSFFHRALTEMPWYQELELESLGAQYLHPDLNVVLLTRDQRHLAWWTDFEKTAASVASFHAGDAERLRHWRSTFRPIVRQILQPEAQAPPLPPAERQSRLAASTLGRQLLEVSQLSPLEFVRREFQHPVVQAGLLFFNGLREVDLRLPGFGHHIPALIASDTLAQMCCGGSQELAKSLVAAVRRVGGEVVTGVRPRRILVEHGRAVGVETDQGTVFHARRFVASGLNPQQTFLDLIEPANLPEVWRSAARSFRYNLLAPLFALYLNLRTPPAYSVLQQNLDLQNALMVILGLDDSRQFESIVADHEAGRVPEMVMWGACPSWFDPSQAPTGLHTAFMWQKVPFALGGDPQQWEREKGPHADRMLKAWSHYAPGLADTVLDRLVRTPLDTVQRLPNMERGDLLVGSFEAGQIGYHRPFPGAGHYRGHLDGLYLCGSCCHPGGNITGLAGYNCAQVLLADLGRAERTMIKQ